MLESVAAFLGLRASDLAANPAIAAIAATLQTILSTIRDLKQVQDRTTKGATRSKGELEAAIIAAIIKIGAALRAYATEAKNYDLVEVATFSDTTIKHLRDSNLADKARTIYEASKDVIGSLGIYQVALTDIVSLRDDIPEYLQALSGSRAILNQTKQSTADIQLKLNEGKLLLKQKLDVYMLPYKVINATLHGEYLNARIIVDKAATHETKTAAGGDGPA